MNPASANHWAESPARVYVLGGLRVEGPRGILLDADLHGSQGRVAFAALVLERRPLSRDAFAEIVWDGRLPNKWEGALATIVSKIRSSLTQVGLDGKQMVSASVGAYALTFPSGAWVDLEDALRRLDRAEGALRHGNAVAATSDATVASGILRRPFLTGIDNEWVESRRRSLRDAAYRCCVVLATAWLERGDHGLAVVVAESAIQLDPLREVGHRLKIAAEWRRGDSGAALRAFRRCEQVLYDELGAHPSAETLALVDTIRA